MGKMLGYFADGEELDRPDLNKCPDCLCFYDGDTCPLCGKVCPEEMRAGNRKTVKKKHRAPNGRAYRPYVPWYHSWWFILIMMFLSPFSIAGIVLLITSPHKRWIKIFFATLMVLYVILSSYGFVLFRTLSNLWNEPVDRSLSEEEYIAACETVTAEELYRAPYTYEDRFVSVTLTVTKRIANSEEYYSGEYATYYVCSNAEGTFTVLIRDCVIEGKNFIVGDIILVYGEGANVTAFYDTDGNSWEGTTVNAAFISRVG